MEGPTRPLSQKIEWLLPQSSPALRPPYKSVVNLCVGRWGGGEDAACAYTPEQYLKTRTYCLFVAEFQCFSPFLNHRVHIEWQWPDSGVHSNMLDKLAQPGGGGVHACTSFHYIYHHVQSCGVRSS